MHHPALPPFYSAYAYSPRENVGSRGGTHIITNERFSTGRLVREPGDALCKPAKKFWGLNSATETKAGLTVYREPTCQRCIAIAKKSPLLHAMTFDFACKEIYE